MQCHGSSDRCFRNGGLLLNEKTTRKYFVGIRQDRLAESILSFVRPRIGQKLSCYQRTVSSTNLGFGQKSQCCGTPGLLNRLSADLVVRTSVRVLRLTLDS